MPPGRWQRLQFAAAQSFSDTHFVLASTVSCCCSVFCDPARIGWPWVAIAPGVAMKRALAAASAATVMANLMRERMTPP